MKKLILFIICLFSTQYAFSQFTLPNGKSFSCTTVKDSKRYFEGSNVTDCNITFNGIKKIYKLSTKECDNYCEEAKTYNIKLAHEEIAKGKEQERLNSLPPEPCSITDDEAVNYSCKVKVSCPVRGREFSSVKRFNCDFACPTRKNKDLKINLSDKDSALVRESFGLVDSESVNAIKSVCATYKKETAHPLAQGKPDEQNQKPKKNQFNK